MAQRRKLLHGDVVEDMLVDYLLKIAVISIDIAEHLAAQTTLIHRYDCVNQLRHLEVVGGGILNMTIILQTTYQMGEEIAQRRCHRHRDVVTATALVARVK